MTLIHPSRKYQLIDLILFALVFLLVGSATWLIMLYNETVNLRHGISEIEDALTGVQAESAELKGQVLYALSPEEISRFASERGLVSEHDPEYLKTNHKWASVSQRSL